MSTITKAARENYGKHPAPPPAPKPRAAPAPVHCPPPPPAPAAPDAACKAAAAKAGVHYGGGVTLAARPHGCYAMSS
eukprot:gene38336-3965_t